MSSEIPKTVPEAIDCLVSQLPKDAIKYIKENPAASIHHTCGRHLRNDWKMWDKESLLNADFRQRYNLFGHADDISSVIYEAIWAKALGKDVEQAIQQQVEAIRTHWIEAGVNPVTGEESEATAV